MTKQEILDTINRWRDLAEGVPILEGQIEAMKRHEHPCLVCIEALTMFASINAILGDVVRAFDQQLLAGEIPMETITELMVVSDRLDAVASRHSVSTECVARMTNAAHKQLMVLGLEPLEGCAVPGIQTQTGEKCQAN